MSREQFVYLAPYAISVVLLTGIFLYALRQRYIRGAGSFAWVVGGQLLTALAFILELISPTLQAKILWDTVQWLTTAFLIVLPLMVFTVRFSEYRLRSPSLTWGSILIFLGVFATFLLSESIHRLFYINPRLTTAQPLQELRYDFTIAMYLYLLLYVYGASFFAISLLIWRAFQPHNIFRAQYLIIAAGFLLPLIVSLLSLINVPLAPYSDLTSLAFAVGSLIAAWGLFRYGLFDIAPTARQQIVETMSDPVIVLDPRNRIIDVNKAGLALIEKQRADVIGRTPQFAFTKLPLLMELVNEPYEQSKEVAHLNDGRTLFLLAGISDLLGPRRERIGRIILVQDITKVKTLDEKYEILSKTVEQRIEQRTEDLYNTAERYRTIVEHFPDFIIRWKSDGTRTFVNEAYCRYWGITEEQALARNFLFHTAEEDRPDIEKKIVRLNSGTAEIETGIYRSIKPDGAIAWHEWTDKAIRDQWGKLVEIQSVGRDITDRRQMEEA